MVDGREASIIVRDYFVQTHGPWGVLVFEIERVNHNGAWTVRCSFFPGLGVTLKSRYEVLVSDEGKILNVSKLGIDG